MCRWMAMSAVIGAVLPQPLAWSSSSESGHPLGDHGLWHLRAGGGAVHSIKSRHSTGGSDGVHRAWRPPENMLTRLLSAVARYQGRSFHAYAVSTQGGEISLSLRFVCLRADAIEFALRTASSTEGEVALPTSDGPQSSSSPHPSRA